MRKDADLGKARRRALGAVAGGALAIGLLVHPEVGATFSSGFDSRPVSLAARGMSNAEIADRLVLSVHTVESHIYRAMQKLGVSDRRDLRA